MRAFAVSLLLLLGGCALAPPATAAPPPWAPAHGYRAKHHYIYYPSHPIYYAPARRHWFWWHDGRWLSGALLPWHLRRHLHGGISLYYDALYPSHFHHYTVRRYPRHHHQHHNSRPYDYHYNSRPWYWQWNDRNHHGDRGRDHGRNHGRNRDRDRHHGRHDGRDWDRDRHQGGRDRGRDGDHNRRPGGDRDRDRHQGRDGGRHAGRDNGRGRDGWHDRDHARQTLRPRAERGPGHEFNRSPRRNDSGPPSNRGRQQHDRGRQRG